MKNKKLKIIKNQPKPKSGLNIQIFLGFINFYGRFIQYFRKKAALFTLMLKTNLTIQLTTSKLSSNIINKTRVDSRSGDQDKRKSLFIFSALSKSLIKADYFTFNSKKFLNLLLNVLIQIPIFYYFDLKCHNHIKTNISCFAIRKNFSQLTLNDLS